MKTNQKKYRAILLCLILTVVINSSCKKPKQLNTTNDPKIRGYVPDKETAAKIGEAVCLALYGDAILDERPFVAHLDGDIWTIEGTLHETHGGAAIVKLQKSDGRILGIGHQK